jgi:hypothetical protein
MALDISMQIQKYLTSDDGKREGVYWHHLLKDCVVAKQA